MFKEVLSNKWLILIYTSITLLALLAGAFLITYQINPTTSAQVKTIQMEIGKEKVKFFNRTNSFQILSNKIVDDRMQLLLKNNYGKSVNGFYATVGSEKENISYNIELSYSDVRDEIPPQEYFTLYASLDKQLFTEGLTIHAVLFSDGTGDGEEDTIQEMRDIRQGEKFQLTKGLELIRDFWELPPNEFSPRLNDLKFNILSLTTNNKNKSSAYNSGLNYGKERLTLYFDEIQKDKNVDVFTTKQKFSKLQSKLEVLVSKP